MEEGLVAALRCCLRTVGLIFWVGGGDRFTGVSEPDGVGDAPYVSSFVGIGGGGGGGRA